MTRVIARRGWLVPLIAFVVVLAAILTVFSSIARGAATTTLSPTPASEVEQASPSLSASASMLGSSSGATQTAVFTVRARDLGSFPADPPKVTSPSAILINMDTDKVLYERRANVRRPMASTTKIMTAILVLENMNLSTPITVSAKAARTPEPKVFLKEGDVLTVEQLLYAMLLRSANSAAVVLAEGMSGSVDAFVAKMNAKAEELGLEDTHFINPNGLDATGHYSTASDMARLARYAMENERFRQLVSTKTYSLSLPGRSEPLILTNTNKLLTNGTDWVIGVKTGLTPRAEQCFVGAGTKDGVSVISVILGEPVPDVCFNESKALMEYGFSQYRHVTLMDQGLVVAKSTVPYQLDGQVALVTKDAVETDLYKDDEVTASIALDRSLVLPVTAGEPFGHVLLTVKGETVGSVDLVADRSYGKTTLGSKLAYFWGRFSRWVGRVI